MKHYLLKTLKLIYSLIEQFVFYFAVIVAFLSWFSFGNIYIAIAVFVVIPVVFWMFPLIFKKNNKY